MHKSFKYQLHSTNMGTHQELLSGSNKIWLAYATRNSVYLYTDKPEEVHLYYSPKDLVDICFHEGELYHIQAGNLIRRDGSCFLAFELIRTLDCCQINPSLSEFHYSLNSKPYYLGAYKRNLCYSSMQGIHRFDSSLLLNLTSISAFCEHQGITYVVEDADEWGTRVSDEHGKGLFDSWNDSINDICSHNNDLYIATGSSVMKLPDGETVASRDSSINSLCSDGNRLYDCGAYGIYDTTNNQLIRKQCAISITPIDENFYMRSLSKFK